jgi:hypothetical protein
MVTVRRIGEGDLQDQRQIQVFSGKYRQHVFRRGGIEKQTTRPDDVMAGCIKGGKGLRGDRFGECDVEGRAGERQDADCRHCQPPKPG